MGRGGQCLSTWSSPQVIDGFALTQFFIFVSAFPLFPLGGEPFVPRTIPGCFTPCSFFPFPPGTSTTVLFGHFRGVSCREKVLGPFVFLSPPSLLVDLLLAAPYFFFRRRHLSFAICAPFDILLPSLRRPRGLFAFCSAPVLPAVRCLSVSRTQHRSYLIPPLPVCSDFGLIPLSFDYYPDFH